MLIFINNIFIKIISILDLNNANNSNFNDDNNCDSINIKASLQNTNIINFQIPSSNIKEYIGNNPQNWEDDAENPHNSSEWQKMLIDVQF